MGRSELDSQVHNTASIAPSAARSGTASLLMSQVRRTAASLDFLKTRVPLGLPKIKGWK